jgi:hypothetical protein
VVITERDLGLGPTETGSFPRGRGAYRRYGEWILRKLARGISGFEKNWIPTIPNKAWFVYFRLYGPTEPYFDKSWPLPDIEEAK